MPAAFTIRRVEAADRAALLGHVRALNIHEDMIARDRATADADTVATLDEALGRVVDSGGIALVAEAEGLVIGHLFLTIETAPPFIRAEFRRRAYIADAFVQEAFRSRGAFRAMLAEAEAHARATGCRQLMIGVLAGNAIAERVYRRAGFRDYAIETIREIPQA
ncbi:N-acetyltransferase family protein [Falsiroseomonas sp.]|uniref:GNAT family N-acetyltransferase n=1 Tax=Falsiroseomonas sp. TaxID=2870721 RepID=UPI0034A37E45